MIFLAGSIIATLLILAAGMLSSRISSQQPFIEEYDFVEYSGQSPNMAPSTFPMES